MEYRSDLLGLSPYLSIFIVLLFGLILGFSMSGFSLLWGPKKPRNANKLEVYECGLPITSTAEHRFSIKFYLTAILFIIFDIETIFLYLWSVLFNALGWFGIIEVALFIFTLIIGLIYVIKRNALRWDKI